MEWRESRRGSIAPGTVSPLTRFHIHLRIAPPPPHTHSFFMFCSKPNRVVTAHMPVQLSHTHSHTQILRWPTGVSQPLHESPPYLGCDVWGCNNARSCLQPFASPVVSSEASWSQLRGSRKGEVADLLSFSLTPAQYSGSRWRCCLK